MSIFDDNIEKSALESHVLEEYQRIDMLVYENDLDVITYNHRGDVIESMQISMTNLLSGINVYKRQDTEKSQAMRMMNKQIEKLEEEIKILKRLLQISSKDAYHKEVDMGKVKWLVDSSGILPKYIQTVIDKVPFIGEPDDDQWTHVHIDKDQFDDTVGFVNNNCNIDEYIRSRRED